MARNRKYQSAAIRFGPAIKAFLLCVLIGGSGVGYVWQKSQISELGQQIRRRELRLNELQEQNEKLKKRLAEMRSPQYLEDHIKGSGLVVPQPGQICRLPEPAAEPSHLAADPQYAQQIAAHAAPE